MFNVQCVKRPGETPQNRLANCILGDVQFVERLWWWIWTARRDLVGLFIHSSLVHCIFAVQMQVRDACVFVVSRHHDLTTQQAEFMLPQLT